MEGKNYSAHVDTVTAARRKRKKLPNANVPSLRPLASKCNAGPIVRPGRRDRKQSYQTMMRDSSRWSSWAAGNWARRNSMKRRARGRPLLRSKPMRKRKTKSK
jgi:hypothetical protein